MDVRFNTLSNLFNQAELAVAHFEERVHEGSKKTVMVVEKLSRKVLEELCQANTAMCLVKLTHDPNGKAQVHVAESQAAENSPFRNVKLLVEGDQVHGFDLHTLSKEDVEKISQAVQGILNAENQKSVTEPSEKSVEAVKPKVKVNRQILRTLAIHDVAHDVKVQFEAAMMGILHMIRAAEAERRKNAEKRMEEQREDRIRHVKDSQKKEDVKLRALAGDVATQASVKAANQYFRESTPVKAPAPTQENAPVPPPVEPLEPTE